MSNHGQRINLFLRALFIANCYGCLFEQAPQCSTCTDPKNMCSFSCSTYHCASGSMCNDFIHNTCKIFEQKDWNCVNMTKTPLCLSCNQYRTVYYTCANLCRDTCYTDTICVKVNEFYSLVDVNDLHKPEDYAVVRNIAATLSKFCSDGYSLTYGFSSFLLLLFLFY